MTAEAVVFRPGSPGGETAAGSVPGPAADRPDTRTRTTTYYENVAQRTDSGTWECEPCGWRRMEMGERAEFFVVTAGSIVLRRDGGEPVHVRAGSSVYSPPGWTGDWRVPEALTKVYVSFYPARP